MTKHCFQRGGYLAAVFAVSLMAVCRISAGEIGTWSFDEGTGARVLDAGPHGSDGTIHGGAPYTYQTPSGLGYALDFNGADGFVSAPDHAARTYDRVVVTSGDVTLEQIALPGYGGVWWDAAWTQRQLLQADNRWGVELQNAAVPIALTWRQGMQADFRDIRCVDEAGTKLDYWIGQATEGVSADIWVLFPTLSGAVCTDFYLYFDNDTAVSESDRDTLFPASSNLSDGSDGALAVTAADTVVNTYAYLTGVAATSATTIAVNDGAGFSDGDKILILQVQNGTDRGSAGHYEIRTIASGGGTAEFTLDQGLDNGYRSGAFNTQDAWVAQVVRIPQYTTVTVESGGSIVAPVWDGTTGGIVIFYASGAVMIESG
ncbi:MAG: DUF2341 domain-containing protein, partial [Lentisphaeria bacterium]|nr:DUF2341 domain-containing protein [Lentisphaeria bacterium]